MRTFIYGSVSFPAGTHEAGREHDAVLQAPLPADSAANDYFYAAVRHPTRSVG